MVYFVVEFAYIPFVFPLLGARKSLAAVEMFTVTVHTRSLSFPVPSHCDIHALEPTTLSQSLPRTLSTPKPPSQPLSIRKLALPTLHRRQRVSETKVRSPNQVLTFNLRAIYSYLAFHRELLNGHVAPWFLVIFSTQGSCRHPTKPVLQSTVHDFPGCGPPLFGRVASLGMNPDDQGLRRERLLCEIDRK